MNPKHPSLPNLAANNDEWLDNYQVMKKLGISKRTLQTLRSNGMLPFSKIRRNCYYRASALEQLLQDNLQQR